jgi:hypothetical protein
MGKSASLRCEPLLGRFRVLRLSARLSLGSGAVWPLLSPKPKPKPTATMLLQRALSPPPQQSLRHAQSTEQGLGRVVGHGERYAVVAAQDAQGLPAPPSS